MDGQTNELNVDTVAAAVANGDFYADNPIGAKYKSPCYKVMKQVFHKNGNPVDNWYYCNTCRIAKFAIVKNGTKVLMNHAKKHDPTLGATKKNPNAINTQKVRGKSRSFIFIVSVANRQYFYCFFSF